jgi:hypothetical protein
MDLPPSSDGAAALQLLTLAGEPVGAPREWELMLVEARIHPDAWTNAELHRGEESLPLALRRLGGEVRVVADWPRSGPGNYRLQLRLNGEVREQIVTVQPEKISRDAYARLLEDLEARLPASVALGLQRTGGLAGVRLLPPGQSTVAEELLRLERAVQGTPGRPGLAKSLAEIARDPHQVLRSSTLWVRRERARRPHPAHLVHALAARNNLLADMRPARVVDTRVEHSVDVYENRLVQAFATQVNQRLRRLLPVLQAGGRQDLLSTARRLTEAMRAARRYASFLDDVGELAHTPDRITMVLLNRPPYRAALEGYLEFQRRVSVRLEESALEAPLENLPQLYQLWGTLEVIGSMLHVAADLGYRLRSEHLVRRSAGAVFVRVLPDGSPAVVLAHPEYGTTVRLIPERSYRHGPGLHSITYTQIPDVAVEVAEPGGSTRVYLFDPKYKLDGEPLEQEGVGTKPKKVDIDKMHTYRDAIRGEGGERVVLYAATLYPGPQRIYRDGIEALSAIPGSADLLAARLHHVLGAALQPPS